MSLSKEIISQKYDWVLFQLARGYQFVMIDDRLGVQLKIKSIEIMLSQISLISLGQAGTWIYYIIKYKI